MKKLAHALFLYQKLFLMRCDVVEKRCWLVIDDNKHTGVQHRNVLFLLNESAFVVEDRLVVPIEKCILFRQLVAIGQDVVCFAQMVDDDAGEGLVVHGAEILVGAFVIDELLVG